jgi:hypothetical protein
VPSDVRPNLNLLKADLSNEIDCIRLKDAILKEHGQLDHVVTSIGGWRTDGPLSNLTVSEYQKALQEMTLPHFVVYRTFANLLNQRPNSTYTFVTGGSCDAARFDPKASMLPPSAGLGYGLYTAAISEHARSKNLKVIQLRPYFWVRRDHDSKFDPKKAQMEVGTDYVAKFVPKIILRNKSEVYKLTTRAVADQLFTTL